MKTEGHWKIRRLSEGREFSRTIRSVTSTISKERMRSVPIGEIVNIYHSKANGVWGNHGAAPRYISLIDGGGRGHVLHTGDLRQITIDITNPMDQSRWSISLITAGIDKPTDFRGERVSVI
ncbi:MAG: hypothetical protein IPF79_02350 [Ignavibacteria bacterium]|nr:hypothetical protein [Ignavibacteria bacterium]